MTSPDRTIAPTPIAQFVRDGFLTVQTGLPSAFHSDLRQRAGVILDREGNWGNNILPRLPDLQRVFDDPAVRGALSSLLGPTYAMHPHRYCHRNEAGSEGQRLHQDTREFSGDKHFRHHRSRWLIAFYYPHDVSTDMGPTAIVPRSQYYLEQPDERQWPERLLCPPGGTVAIVHFDMWHRATANRSAGPRYMFKFEFVRMDEPDTVDASEPEPGPATEGELGPAPHRAAWSRLERWIRGAGGETSSDQVGADPVLQLDALRSSDVPTRRAAADAIACQPLAAREVIPALLELLGDDDEPVRLNAAYALAAAGTPAASTVGNLLLRSGDPTRRYAAYALSAMGEPAIETLMELAEADDESVSIAAIDALGEVGSPATPAVAILAERLHAANPWIRRHAADALGTLGPGAVPAVRALVGLLTDEQPYVRLNAATAIARIGPAATEAVPALVGALKDTDRYARGWAALALRRIGTPEAMSGLIDDLMVGRWCSTTTAENRY